MPIAETALVTYFRHVGEEGRGSARDPQPVAAAGKLPPLPSVAVPCAPHLSEVPATQAGLDARTPCAAPVGGSTPAPHGRKGNPGRSRRKAG